MCENNIICEELQHCCNNPLFCTECNEHDDSCHCCAKPHKKHKCCCCKFMEKADQVEDIANEIKQDYSTIKNRIVGNENLIEENRDRISEEVQRAIDKENQLESLITGGVDLDNYYTKFEVDRKISSIVIDPVDPVDLTAYAKTEDVYTKSQVDNQQQQQDLEIAKKADRASLSTVATSGSYNDLSNKPTIPSTDGLASEQYVRNYTYDKQTIDEKVAQGGTFDSAQYYNKTATDQRISTATTDMATMTWVGNQGYITTNDIPEGAAASTTTPKMDGTASVGTELTFARGDHRHPSDTTKVDKIDGKGLSTNDYTDAERDKLWSLNNVTESTVSDWGFTKNTGTYSKPSGGIPKTDLASSVQTSLGKADTALQSFTETDPTVPAWAKQASKPTYTASEVGALPANTQLFSGDYNDLTNKPTIPEGAIVDSALSKTSTNPVQNKVIAEALENISSVSDKEYDPSNNSGMGKKTLKLTNGSNTLSQSDFDQENTIYVIEYDFDLNGGEISVPDGSIIEFNGGSINNGTFKFNGATVEGQPKGTALYGVAYKDGKALSHNYKRILPMSEVTEYAFASKKPFGCQLRIEGSMQSICVTDDYVFVFGNDEYGTYADTGIVALFDRKYNYLGQARIVEFEHANGCCVVDSYIFCASRSGSIAYVPMSNIVTACNNNGTVSGVSTISISSVQTSFAIAYDSVRKEMLIIDSTNGENLYYNIFSYNSTSKTLTLKKHFNINIIDSIDEFIESPIIDHRGLLRGAPGNITYKNGVIYMVYWYHGGGDAEDTWYPSAHSVGYLIEIDACTGLPVANIGLFKQIGSVTEPEGLCFDPEDEDVLWTLPQSVFFREDWARPGAAYINKISFIKEVSSSILNYLPEINDTLPAQLAKRYAFVDNTSTDTTATSSARTTAMNKVSTGSQACPFKSLDTAIILTKTGNDINIVLTDTGKEYDLGTLVIINQKVTITGSGNAKIKGKIQLQNADLTLVGVKFYNYDGGIAISSTNSDITLSNVSIINRNSTSDPTSILDGTAIDLMYKSVLTLAGSLTIRGYRTGILVERDSNVVPLNTLTAKYVGAVYSIDDSYNINSNIISKISADSTVTRKYITNEANVILYEDVPSNITTMSAFESYASTLLEKDMDNPMSIRFIYKGGGQIPAGEYMYSPTGLVHANEWCDSIPQDHSNIFIGTASPSVVDDTDQQTIDNGFWRKASGYPVPSTTTVSVDWIPQIKKGFYFTSSSQRVAKEFYIKRDCWITFSVLAKGSGTLRLQFVDKNNTVKYWDYTISSSDWKQVSMTVSAFDVNGVGNFYIGCMSGSSVYVCAPKAEFASKLTAWTPNEKDYPKLGTTSERPVGVENGYLYYDYDLQKLIIYYNGQWADPQDGGRFISV